MRIVGHHAVVIGASMAGLLTATSSRRAELISANVGPRCRLMRERKRPPSNEST
jgi:hypothetical protein